MRLAELIAQFTPEETERYRALLGRAAAVNTAAEATVLRTAARDIFAAVLERLAEGEAETVAAHLLEELAGLRPLADWPSPIALPYQDMLVTEHVQLQFRALIKAFNSTLRYAALIALSDYLRSRTRLPEEEMEGLNQLLRERIERPSLGHWNNFLRELLAAFRGQERRELLFVPELYGFYYRVMEGEELQQRDIVRRIDHLISVRNEYVHPDIYPEDAIAAERYAQGKQDLDGLLACLSFLCDYPLVRCLWKDEMVEVCRGPAAPGEIRESQSISFRLLPRDTAVPSTVGLDDWPHLSLGMFVHSGLGDSEESRHPLLYESKLPKGIQYTLANRRVLVGKGVPSDAGDGGAFEKMTALLNDLARQVHDGAEDRDNEAARLFREQFAAGCLSWETARERLAEVTEATRLSLVGEGKFDGELYVGRGRIDQEINRFIERDGERGLIVVADSGLGKTNLFCDWAHNLQADHAVLFLSGRQYDGTPIGDLVVTQLMGNEQPSGVFPELVTQLEHARGGAAGKLFVLFDAVNEAKDPERMLRALTEFVSSLEADWIKVMFSIRVFVWESLKDKCLLDPTPYHWAQDATGRSGPFVGLGPFSDEELETAYGKYASDYRIGTRLEEDLSPATRKLFRNPLLLRFATEAYQGDSASLGHIPPDVFCAKIFEQYTRERIRHEGPHSDVFFLDYLIEAMWRIRSDVLRHSEFTSPGLGSTRSELLREPETHRDDSDSRRVGGAKSLAGSLSAYIAGDPVYEKTLAPTCNTPGCRNQNVILPLGLLDGEDDGDRPVCPRCRVRLGRRPVDTRTSYVRMLDENILQEKQIGDDLVICFTHDRMFEYLVGRFLRAGPMIGLVSGELAALERLAVLDRVTARVEGHQIFWGPVRNVIMDVLRAGEVKGDLWLRLLDGGDGGPEEEAEVPPTVDAAARSISRRILASALAESHAEDSGKVAAILRHITDPQHATESTMRIALEVGMTAVVAAEEFALDSAPSQVLRRGLRYPKNTIRMESARILLALYGMGRDTVRRLAEELQESISSWISVRGIVTLRMSPRAREEVKRLIDSLANIFVFIVGAHFAEESTEDGLAGIGKRVLAGVVRHPVVSLLRWPLMRFLGIKVAGMYWRKGPNACNYLEMHLSLKSDSRHVTDSIASLFEQPDWPRAEKENLRELFKIENGLITWYLYSLLPILARNHGNPKEVLDFLVAVFEGSEDSQPARYTAMSALWILAELSDVVPDLVAPLYVEYSRRYLELDGGWVTFTHRCAYDKKVKEYVEERDETGERRAYWARYSEEHGTLVMRYDNFAMWRLAEFVAARQETRRLDFIVDLLDSYRRRSACEFCEFLTYCVETLGAIGERFPDVALRTLQYLIEEWIDFRRPVTFHGRCRTPAEQVVRASLLRIKSYHPKAVDGMVEALPAEHLQRLRSVVMLEPEPEPDAMLSYCGERIYQRAFLTSEGCRRTFGRGVARAGRARSVSQLFAAFSREILVWLRSD